MTRQEFEALGITKYDLVVVTYPADLELEDALIFKNFGFCELNEKGEILFSDYLAHWESEKNKVNVGIFTNVRHIVDVEVIKKDYWSEK